jgi:hypothetical protein
MAPARTPAANTMPHAIACFMLLLRCRKRGEPSAASFAASALSYAGRSSSLSASS